MGRLVIKEHEPMISTTYGVLPQSKASEIIRGAKAREEAQRAAAAAEAAKRPAPKSCPFRSGASSTCKEEVCALFDNGTCAIATGAQVKEKGLCPFGNGYQPCGANCALNINGHCAMSRKETL